MARTRAFFLSPAQVKRPRHRRHQAWWDATWRLAAVDYAVPTRAEVVCTDKRGQVWCRPFFTTFLSLRRLSYLSRSVAHGRYFLALRRPLLSLSLSSCDPVFTPLATPFFFFLSLPLSFSLVGSLSLSSVDLLANNRVYRGFMASCRCVCGSRKIVVRGMIDISRRVTAPKVSHQPLLFVSSLLSVNIFVRALKTNPTDQSNAK